MDNMKHYIWRTDNKINSPIDWTMQDTGVIRLPRNEHFVSFMKIKRKMYILSNKAIYQVKQKKIRRKSR